jgi:hypothetical protein
MKFALPAASSHGSTRVSSLGNCYPDHLFHRARRLLHRIALTTAVVAAIGASRCVTFIVGDVDTGKTGDAASCQPRCGSGKSIKCTVIQLHPMADLDQRARSTADCRRSRNPLFVEGERRITASASAVRATADKSAPIRCGARCSRGGPARGRGAAPNLFRMPQPYSYRDMS